MKKHLTKLFYLALIVLFSQNVYAQTDSLSVNKGGKNLINVSLTSLLLNNFSFTYERAVAKKISVGLGLRFMPEGQVPFLNKFEAIIDDEDTFDKLKDLKTGNIAITPEVKFYFGKGVFRGFYIAPFARYAKYTADLPTFEYEYDHPVDGPTTTTIPLNGELKTLTGGVLFGAQWKLSKLVYLNWSILGPQYGTSKGFLKGTKTLSAEEQDALRDELEDLELPIVETTTTVNSSGARMDIKGPWASARASVGLSFRF